MTQPKTYPKGGRCAACKHRDADCSWRDFESMPPMQKDGEEMIVKCTEYERDKDMKPLKKGDRIELKVRTILGWKGTGTVMEDQITPESGVRFIKDGAQPGTAEYEIGCDACRHEVAVLRSSR